MSFLVFRTWNHFKVEVLVACASVGVGAGAPVQASVGLLHARDYQHGAVTESLRKPFNVISEVCSQVPPMLKFNRSYLDAIFKICYKIVSQELTS